MNLFNLDTGLMIWTWACFLIIFGVMAKIVIPRFLKSLKERETTINQALDDAALVKERLLAMDAEREKLIRRAQNDADDLVRQARLEAENVKKQILAKADDEARGIAKLAEAGIAEERTKMLEALEQDIARLVCDGSEQLIGHAFLDADDRAWTKDLVKTL